MRLPLLIVLLAGCGRGGGTGDVDVVKAKPTTSVSPDLVASTWQVRLAVDAARAPFEGRSSWVAYFSGKRSEAIQAMSGESDDLGLARLHTEYAAIYRQAALMAAHSTTQVYGVDAQPTDPVEVSYLLGVSGALLGDATWRGRLGGAKTSKLPTVVAQDAAWKSWSDAGAAWPPDAPASTSPGAPAADAAGPLPDAGTLPHYEMPEQGEGGLAAKGGDPGTMWAISRWHEAKAMALAKEHGPVVQAMLDPWRVPAEPKESRAVEQVPDTFLFMSASATAGDLLLLSGLEKDGYAAVDQHQADSPYAVVIKKCTSGNAVTVDCVLDEGAALGQAIEDAMATAAGGQQSFHRMFAEYARVGLMRAADRAALALQDRDGSGRLRINAYDRNTGNTLDPLFLVSVAAWDAGNRNSVRAEELVHAQLTEVPGLEAARIPLDSMHIRLSRNAAPGRPMH